VTIGQAPISRGEKPQQDEVVDMIANRVRGMKIVHTGVLALASALWFWGWLVFLLYITPGEGHLNWSRYLIYCALVVTALGMDFIVAQVRNSDLLNVDLSAVLGRSFRQTLTIVATVLLFLFAAKDQVMSRIFLFTFTPALFALLVFLNRSLPPALARFLFYPCHRERTILVGELNECERILSWCERKAHYGLKVIGVVSNKPESACRGIPFLGSPRELEEIIVAHRVTQIISLRLPQSVGRFVRLAALCDRLGLRLLAINDLQRSFHRPISFFQDGGFQFVSLRQEPLQCPFNRMIKKGVDMAIALPVVIFILPVLSLGVLLLHRLQSPGPLFFRQRRTGIGTRSFYIYKFRTMHVDQGDETRQATANDARVFRMGRWMRKLSIDEIPQFINVLSGHMSIVGPRPHIPEHDHLFAKVAKEYPVRSLVKPGITGLAQVRGFRGEATTDAAVVKRVEADVYYLENWSLVMEWMIIFRTAWQMVVPPRSAY
jgi:exopolysaccharide biosynthesis polyprenyl glycosylphosphotransferase